MTLPHLNLLLAIIGLVVVAYAVNTSVDQRLPTMTLNFSYWEVAWTKGTAPAHLRCGQGYISEVVISIHYPRTLSMKMIQGGPSGIQRWITGGRPSTKNNRK